jgi:hypothetical protein
MTWGEKLAAQVRQVYLWAECKRILAHFIGEPRVDHHWRPIAFAILVTWRVQLLFAQLLVAAFSAALGDDLANYVCRTTAPTVLTSPIKMSLHTATPGNNGASEVSGGAGPYARVSAGYSAASGGACALAATLSFTGMPNATVTHVGLWDTNATTPKFLQGAALGASQAVGAGNTLQITAATNTFTGT